jgi:hypothetical protein
MRDSLNRFFLAFVLVACSLSAHVVDAAIDNKDHPILSRMPGYVVHSKTTQDFDGVHLQSYQINGRIKDAEFPLSFEGRTTYFEYRAPTRSASNFAIYKGYLEAVHLLGGHQLNSEFERDSKGVSERLHVFEIASKGGRPTVVVLKIEETSGNYFLTIIEPTALSHGVKVGTEQGQPQVR